MAKSNKKKNVRASSGEMQEEKAKQKFTKKIVISISVIIFYTLFGAGLGWFNNYSGEYYSKIMSCIGVGFIVFISLMIAMNKKISNKGDFRIFILLHCLMFICSFGFICSAAQEEGNKDRVTPEKKANQLLEDKQTGSRPEDNIFQKTVYLMKEDPYFENGLEKYIGELKDISDEEIIEVMVGILLENLNNVGNKEKREKSEVYDEHTRVANQRYKVYEFQCELEKEDGITEEALIQDRLSDLENSLSSRESADEEYRDSENERLMGVGYRELGDEYQRKGDLKKALDAYEKSGKWFMCAIYLAATTKNFEKIYKCQEGFRALDKEIQNIDKTNNTIKLINRSLKVYDLFIEKICE